MSIWRPDPTFYLSPKMAMQSPPEKLAFVAMLNGKDNGRPDALQEHRTRAVVWSLPPIVLGHALSIGVVVLIAG